MNLLYKLVQFCIIHMYNLSYCVSLCLSSLALNKNWHFHKCISFITINQKSKLSAHILHSIIPYLNYLNYKQDSFSSQALILYTVN